MLRNSMPKLTALLAGYYHQDCFLDGSTPDKILNFYIEGESAVTINDAILEIEELLAQKCDDDEMTACFFNDLSCSYDPTADGWPTIRSWLLHVIDRLNQAGLAK